MTEPRLLECTLRGSLEAHFERIHMLFDKMEQQKQRVDHLSDALVRARVAVHEWIANVVQRGVFPGRTPEVVLCLAQTRKYIYCIVEDNSLGLGLTQRLRELRCEDIQHLPARGMGLLLVKGCTVSATYRRVGLQRNRLTLVFEETCIEKEEAAYALEA